MYNSIPGVTLREYLQYLDLYYGSTLQYLDTPQIEQGLGVRVSDQQVTEEWAAGTEDGLVYWYLLVV